LPSGQKSSESRPPSPALDAIVRRFINSEDKNAEDSRSKCSQSDGCSRSRESLKRFRFMVISFVNEQNISDKVDYICASFQNTFGVLELIDDDIS
jgi:hypothetical protein